MDTKWKKNKAVIGFISWFLGISILAFNVWMLFMEFSCYGGNFKKQVETVFQEDYQNMEEFRSSISDYLNLFLAMSVADKNLPDGNRNQGEATWAEEKEVESEWDQYVYAEEYSEDYGYDYKDSYYWQGDGWRMDAAEAEEYHKDMKNERNILYRIEKEGKVLFTNEESLGFMADSVPVLPEGYNFLLYFNGEEVKIWKDGREIEIYGDGYYREKSAWYVPGYYNFPVGEAIKDSEVFIAAAKVPIIYINNDFDRYYHVYTNDRLYDMQNNIRSKKMAYEEWIFTSVFALALLFTGLVFRRERKAAEFAIAEFTGKLWYEVKLLPVLAVLGFLLLLFLRFINDLWWMEWNYVYEYIDRFIYYRYYRGPLMQVFLYSIVFMCILILWLFMNDRRYHKSAWKKSLTGMVIRTCQTASIKLPIGKRMVRQNIAICFFIWIMCITGFLFWIVAEEGIFMDEMELVCYVLLEGITLCIPFLFIKNAKKMARAMDNLVGQIQAIHDGELEEEREMPEDSGLWEAVENLNDIRNGMDKAVKEQIKSERMKVELVANVSHDIKTPLTSIISYVELLKKEEELPEHVKEYVDILDSKSQRLKSMIQDVFEVSKAVSGNLPVLMEDLDLAKLLRQTIADMEEQIEKSAITVKTEIPGNPVIIHADGERMYRVFQNLIQNALKYSLEGSRVYITLQENGKTAVACVKNISKEELNPDIDFTERFARGDKSRSDGGSGLGLSIAQSFTEACGGEFRVEAMADLFVVTISFVQQLSAIS